MYLYELALKIDERSADLAVRARELGLAGATPSTMLTAPQAAALRSGVPMPPGPGGSGSTLIADDPDTPPPPPSGPLAWAEDPADPVAATGAPLATTTATATATTPSTEPPLSTLPPPPGARGAGPNEPATSAGRLTPARSKVARYAAVAVVVIAAVAFLVWNSSHGDGREAALAAHNARIDAQTEAEASKDAAKLNGGAGSSAGPGAAPAVSREIVDQPSFCAAARGVQIVEFRAGANQAGTDWAASRKAVVAGKEAWLTSVNGLIDTSSGQLQASISSYRSIYGSLLDSVEASTSLPEFQAAFAAVPLAKLGPAAAQVNQAIQTCA